MRPSVSATPQLLARTEAQFYRRDDAEQAVTADSESEQLGVFRPAAGPGRALGVDQDEGLHIGDHGLQGQAPAVNVGGQRTAEAEPIGAGLLLADAPGPARAALRLDQMVDQRRPLNSGFDLDQALVLVEIQHPGHGGGVDQHRVLAKLLAAHGMAAAGDADGLAGLASTPNGGL
jgi:hypothetical protein